MLNRNRTFDLIMMVLFLLLSIEPATALAAEPLGKRIVLENGMILLLSEKHDIPMVTVSMAIKAGNTSAPADKPGIASLTARYVEAMRRFARAMAHPDGPPAGFGGAGSASAPEIAQLFPVLPESELAPRSRLIMTYALCGFANLGSLGIMIGGLATMAPERRSEIVALGARTLVSGTLATLIAGATVGVLS